MFLVWPRNFTMGSPAEGRYRFAPTARDTSHYLHQSSINTYTADYLLLVNNKYIQFTVQTLSYLDVCALHVNFDAL